MKPLASITLVAMLGAIPALAQEETGKAREGMSLMQQGAELLFQGLLEEMQPALEDLQGLAEEVEPRFQLLVTEMGPKLLELLDRIDDIRNYEAPEIQPNGDILIRRRPDAPTYVPPESADPIDL